MTCAAPPPLGQRYIESCVAQGIVSGVGGGRFSPAGNLTGSQLAKMLLVALGYDADIEGYYRQRLGYQRQRDRATQSGPVRGPGEPGCLRAL
ncbi:MAG: S-layer homology domain-containing protein [Evtepia gabavorous]